jgi:rare lipoprotein A
VALSPKSEARLPASPGPLPVIFQAMPKGEVGVASWYGSKHQGRATASGESFDMHRLTAAHRELPLGTTVRVTNLINLKSVVVRVNDRGPGIDGRLIDVSWAAATKLGFVHAGLAPVEVEVVSYPKSYLQAETGPSSSRVN